MHLQVSCNFIDLASLVLDIRLNTLTFKFLQHQEDKSLHKDHLLQLSLLQLHLLQLQFIYYIYHLLQLPLHLFILTLKE